MKYSVFYSSDDYEVHLQGKTDDLGEAVGMVTTLLLKGYHARVEINF